MWMESKIYYGVQNLLWSPKFIMESKIYFGVQNLFWSPKFILELMESKIYFGTAQTKVWTPVIYFPNSNGVQNLFWNCPN